MKNKVISLMALGRSPSPRHCSREINFVNICLIKLNISCCVDKKTMNIFLSCLIFFNHIDTIDICLFLYLIEY